MFIGFSSSTYTATESEQQVTVCVQVLNSESGGALRSFSVSILPEEGMKCILSCTLPFTFNFSFCAF